MYKYSFGYVIDHEMTINIITPEDILGTTIDFDELYNLIYYENDEKIIYQDFCKEIDKAMCNDYILPYEFAVDYRTIYGYKTTYKKACKACKAIIKDILINKNS